MTKKNKIDRKREGPITISLNDKTDGSPIRELLPLPSGLHTITDLGIYQTLLADDIDPERTNINVPNVHKRVSNHGAQSEIVSRVLLQAMDLFKPTFIAKEFDCDKCTGMALDLTLLLLNTQEIGDVITKKIEDIISAGLDPNTGQSQRIPTVNNLQEDVKVYILSLNKIRTKILSIFKEIYQISLDNKKLSAKLKKAVETKHGKDAGLLHYLEITMPTLEFVRNLRNSIEHEKPNQQQLIISDFTLTPSNMVDPPMLQLLHFETPQKRLNITSFIQQMNEGLINMAEALIFYLAHDNLSGFGGFNMKISERSAADRKYPMVKYGYVTLLNGEWRDIG